MVLVPLSLGTSGLQEQRGSWLFDKVTDLFVFSLCAARYSKSLYVIFHTNAPSIALGSAHCFKFSIFSSVAVSGCLEHLKLFHGQVSLTYTSPRNECTYNACFASLSRTNGSIVRYSACCPCPRSLFVSSLPNYILVLASTRRSADCEIGTNGVCFLPLFLHFSSSFFSLLLFFFHYSLSIIPISSFFLLGFSVILFLFFFPLFPVFSLSAAGTLHTSGVNDLYSTSFKLYWQLVISVSSSNREASSVNNPLLNEALFSPSSLLLSCFCGRHSAETLNPPAKLKGSEK